MRSLYYSIKPYIPEENHEIVAVDEHLEGLGFYDKLLVERVSTSRNPYPFYILPEQLDSEIMEMKKSSLSHLFICRKKFAGTITKNALDNAGISCAC
jgi:hypothetical protein